MLAHEGRIAGPGSIPARAAIYRNGVFVSADRVSSVRESLRQLVVSQPDFSKKGFPSGVGAHRSEQGIALDP